MMTYIEVNWSLCWAQIRKDTNISPIFYLEEKTYGSLGIAKTIKNSRVTTK